MINNISEFKHEYEKTCGAAVLAYDSALKQYNLSLEKFIRTHICDDESFDDLYKTSWLEALHIYCCGSDNLTKTMVLEHIIYESRWPLESE